MIQVEVNADSISPYTGQRITTVVATYPRYVHSELLTHRAFSRNSSSSRAIPNNKLLSLIEANPVIPLVWGANQSGMQAGDELDAKTTEMLDMIWRDAATCAVSHARQLTEWGLHKQWANRVVEPWMHITTIITATNWNNFFRLRCHEAAQPDIHALADAIKEAMDASEPKVSSAHIPFNAHVPDDFSVYEVVKVATGRVARVSYLTHDGFRDVVKDLDLHDRLLSDQHMSPFEHCAFAMPDTYGRRCGNFVGWCQYRHAVDWEDNWLGTDHSAYAKAYFS